METSLGSLQNYREGLVVRWKNEEMNRASTPAKRWDQGGFLGPHTCFSYTVTPSWDERLWLAYFSLCQTLFCCIFQEEGLCVVSGRVPGCRAALPWLELLDAGWAAEGTRSWAPVAGLCTSSHGSRRGA